MLTNKQTDGQEMMLARINSNVLMEQTKLRNAYIKRKKIVD